MSKFFVLSHPTHRFRDDFFSCGTHVFRPRCNESDANLNGWRASLLYWWEYEFGDPQSSLDARHNCFWGQFRLMVDQVEESVLKESSYPFSFQTAQMTEGASLNGQESIALKSVTVGCSVEADAAASKNAVCPTYGTFSERRRQITRLRVPAANVPDFGIFTIRQNGGSGPMFVTETAHVELTASGITGIGYYPAGRVV